MLHAKANNVYGMDASITHPMATAAPAPWREAVLCDVPIYAYL